MNREFGEVPGYEFETPRGMATGAGHGVPPAAPDPLRALRPAPERPAPSLVVRVAAGAVGVMRARNLVTSLAIPIVAAIVVGIAAVVVTGGGGQGGSAATSALADGFPPARLAGADFTAGAGAGGAPRVILAAITAVGATDVVAGSADGGPALWVSGNGGSNWARTALTGTAALTRAGSGQLTAVAHGEAGWLAVGTTMAGRRGPVVAASPDSRTWTVTRGVAAAPGTAADGVAAGPTGYVIVGHQPTARGGAAVAWYARGLTGWRRAAVTGFGAKAPGEPGAAGGQAMNAVTATGRGFAAVGSAGTRPAAWLSATGLSWHPAAVPLPDGAARAALDDVAAAGRNVVAAGTEVSAAGASRPFAVVSGDAGATWTPLSLPAPAGRGATAVTALAAAGHGFIATGTAGAAGGTDVVVWTLPDRAGGGAGAAWTVVAPQGTGLAGPGVQAITALTAQGATLTGIGFTAKSAVQQPTLWQSPIRY